MLRIKIKRIIERNKESVIISYFLTVMAAWFTFPMSGGLAAKDIIMN
jgi:hypothetical protein